MHNKIICTAKFTAKSDKKEQLKKHLEKLLEVTRKEKGCISYTLNIHKDDSDVFMVLEKYRSFKDFEIHLNSIYIKDFLNVIEDLTKVNGISVDIFEEVDI